MSATGIPPFEVPLNILEILGSLAVDVAGQIEIELAFCSISSKGTTRASSEDFPPDD